MVVTFTFQWQDSLDGLTGWANIVGATGQDYTVTLGNVGRWLRCAVTAHNPSTATAVTAPALVTNELWVAALEDDGVGTVLLHDYHLDGVLV